MMVVVVMAMAMRIGTDVGDDDDGGAIETIQLENLNGTVLLLQCHVFLLALVLAKSLLGGDF